nr:Gag-Pol polyprotein [Tanacetum cinerariifolium]
MTTPNITSSTDSQMHNNIIAAGSRDRPSMLDQDDILNGVHVQVVDETNDSPAVEHTTVETPMNMSPENKAHFLAEKEAIHLILTGIGDEIYLTVDACKTAQEMWEAIKRLQQEWSRFVTIIKQQHKLGEVSYHKLFDILKQYQNEVNELRVERLARNANPLALVATALADQEQYYQTSMSPRSQAPSSKPSIPTRSHTSTKHKGKEIAKLITPPSEAASEEDIDPEQAQRDKDM